MGPQTDNRKKSGENRRSSFRPFILARRFGSWGSRNRSDDDDVDHSREHQHMSPDGFLNILDVDGSDEDDESISSRYTDARSTLGSVGHDGDGMTYFSLNTPLIVEDDASGPAQHDRDLDHYPDRSARTRHASASATPHYEHRDEYRPVHGKGKSSERSLDWSSSQNPWAAIETMKDEAEEQRALAAENARLRGEVDHLKGALSKQQIALAMQRPSRTRTPSATPSSRGGRKAKGNSELEASRFDTTTLRDLVLKRIFTPHLVANNTAASAPEDGDHIVTLDTPLTSPQIQAFTRIMNDVILEGQNLKQPIALCAVCHLPKFKEVRGLNQSSYISEVLSQIPGLSATFDDFHPVLGASKCCRRLVCKTCLSAAIIAGIRNQWWLDLPDRDSAWLKCPVPCCRHNLPLQNSDEVLDVLLAIGVADDAAAIHTEQFSHASELRLALQLLDPLPNREEMRRSIVLHRRLARLDRMWPLLEAMSQPDNASEVKADLLRVDTTDGRGTMNVPIFTHLLKPRRPRECIVCEETYAEFDRGGLQSWAKAIRGFGGEWAWRILDFPVPEVLPSCFHDLNICRKCLSTYIATQIETRGHSVVDDIACPTLDCAHKYSHSEIRDLASPQTFAIYDRYAVLNSLSSLSNFRWCLGEGCTAGSLYDEPSAPHDGIHDGADPNHIVCNECDFAMCFTCQRPWHTDLSCAQYASLRTYGDPNHTSTQDWLSLNTKPCPGEGCGVPVQKDDGCFHMTCPNCRVEFCWECLAEWGDILVFEVGDAGERIPRFRPEGHREGCYFRSEGAVMPTRVVGTTLEEGLRALRAEGDG